MFPMDHGNGRRKCRNNWNAHSAKRSSRLRVSRKYYCNRSGIRRRDSVTAVATRFEIFGWPAGRPSFSGNIRARKVTFAAKLMRDLAEAYTLTGRARYAAAAGSCSCDSRKLIPGTSCIAGMARLSTWNHARQFSGWRASRGGTGVSAQQARQQASHRILDGGTGSWGGHGGIFRTPMRGGLRSDL